MRDEGDRDFGDREEDKEETIQLSACCGFHRHAVRLDFAGRNAAASWPSQSAALGR